MNADSITSLWFLILHQPLGSSKNSHWQVYKIQKTQKPSDQDRDTPAPITVVESQVQM